MLRLDHPDTQSQLLYASIGKERLQQRLSGLCGICTKPFNSGLHLSVLVMYRTGSADWWLAKVLSIS